jgi:DNA polymerase-4
MNPRKIIHLDLDAFFCAVEELRDPSLRGKAFAVGGKPEDRGVVASCSYPARKCGVRSAMPMGRALGLCPGLIVVPGRHHLYSDFSRQVMERLHDVSGLVEQVSIDEAFIDVSDLQEPVEETSRKLQERIRSELSLPCSLGAATNKLVAKIATDVGKARKRSSGSPPCAITVVKPGEEAAFLAPLPVEALWGVGPKTAEKLRSLGIETIGVLAQWPEQTLHDLFGKSGLELAERTRGIDDSPIYTSHITKSISQETTFSKDVKEGEVLRATLKELSQGVGRQLRREKLAGTTIKLKIRWPDFTTLSRQVTLLQPTDQDEEIYRAALPLFEKVWKRGQPVRLLGVGASGLGPPLRQLGLWDQESEKRRKLQHALDEIEAKLGRDVIRRGKKG